MVHPSEITSKAPIWAALRDPGIKRALIVGIGIQILQQVGYGFFQLCLAPLLLLLNENMNLRNSVSPVPVRASALI